MPSFSTIFASVTSLAAVSSVAAYSSGTKPLLGRQPYADCGDGTWWHNCANGYRGCYAYDVCAFPPIAGSSTTLATMTTSTTSPAWSHDDHTATATSTFTSMALQSSSVDVKSTSTSTSPDALPTKEMCPPAGNVTKIFMPTMYDLSPDEPDTARIPSRYLEIRKQAGYPQQVQVAVFRNVPSTAKKCSLVWNLARLVTRNEVTGRDATRHMLTDTNAALRVYTIRSEIPANDSEFTYNAVREILTAQGTKPFDPATFDAATREYVNPELTFWDTIDIANTIPFAEVDCAKDIAVYIELDDNPHFGRGDGRLVMKQDLMNGISLDYSC